MDAYTNTKVLEKIGLNLSDCKTKLEHCILTIKAEYRIADLMLAGEQFEKMRDETMTLCENINGTIDGLSRAKAYLDELEPEIISYDGTRF